MVDITYDPLMDTEDLLLLRVRRAAERRIEAEDEFVEAVRAAYREGVEGGKHRFSGEVLARAALVSRQRVYQIVQHGTSQADQGGG